VRLLRLASLLNRPAVRRLAAAILCALAFHSTSAMGASQDVSLSALEQMVAEAPGLLAEQRSIAAAIAGVRVEKDKSGLAYVYMNDFGPQAQIVPRSTDFHVLTFSQLGGVQLPLLGTRIAQQLAIIDAQQREQLSRVEFAEAKRTRIAALRNAYVEYWKYVNDASVSRQYSSDDNKALAKARVLRQTGFWTESNLLDFLDTLEKVKTNLRTSESSARRQLAQIDSAIGTEVEPFHPLTPEFFTGCELDRTRALASAFLIDSTIARTDAAIAQTNKKYARVHGTSVEGTASLQVSSTTDINQRVSGYGLHAILNVGVPGHGRDEERGLRAEYSAELQSLKLDEDQRRVELTAAVDSALADLAGSQDTLAQTLTDLSAKQGDLRRALVRYRTVEQAGSTGFEDVHMKADELYVAQRAAVEARADRLLKANALLAIAPGVCPRPYESMPTPAPDPTAAPKRHVHWFRNIPPVRKKHPKTPPEPANTPNPSP